VPGYNETPVEKRPLQGKDESSESSGETNNGLGGTSGDNRNLGVLRLARLSGSLRLLRLGRLLGLVGGLGLDRSLGLGRSLRLHRLGGSLRAVRSLRLARDNGLLRLGLRDNNDRRLARNDRLRGAERLGRRDGRVNGLALAVGALLVAVAVIVALVEVVAILLNVTDKLAGIVHRGLALAAGSVADNALVALLLLVVGVVTASALTDLELVPGIVVAFFGRTEAVVANDLELGAAGAVSLGSAVVAVADDDHVGGDSSDNSGDSLGGSLTALGVGNGSGGGDRRESLGDEVSVDDGLGLATRVDTNSDVDGEENVDVNSLSAHHSGAVVEATAVLRVIARADNIALIGADRGGGRKIKLVTAVAARIIETEEARSETRLGTEVGVVVLAGVGEGEAREATAREAAEEVEAIRASDASSSSSAGRSSGSLGSGGLGADGSSARGGSAGLKSSGGGVGEASGGELSSGHVAHGKGEDLGVAHLEGGV